MRGKIILVIGYTIGCIACDNVDYFASSTEIYDSGVVNCDSSNPCEEDWYCPNEQIEEPRCWDDGQYLGDGCHHNLVSDIMGNGYPLDCFPTADGELNSGICVDGTCIKRQ